MARARVGPVVQSRPAGVALILVLWLLVLLGVVTATIAHRAHLEARMVEADRARTLGRYAAESGIVLATHRIEEILDSTPELGERATAFRTDTLGTWGRDRELGNARFRVAVIDLNARVDLNRANPTTLGNLFAEFTTQSRAEAVVAALRAEPLFRVAELARVPGVDDSLALLVAPYITVWSDGLININSAPEAVLAALPGVGQAVARSLVRRRDAGEVFTTPTVVLPLIPLRGRAARSLRSVSIAPTRLLLVSRGWERGVPLTHEIQAVFAIVDSALVLQSWEEHDR